MTHNCSHCNEYSPTMLALRCICGKADLICPGCLRLLADALEAGEPIPVAHAHPSGYPRGKP